MRGYNILKEAKDVPKPNWRMFWKQDHNPLTGKTKQRRLCVPCGEKMKEIQGILKNRVRALSKDLPSATGCRKGISTMDSINRHKSKFGKKMVFNRYIFIIDLKNAYRSVDSSKLALVLAKINPKQFSGYRNTIIFVEDYCFDKEQGGVAMGAPASNELFNIYCEHLIDRQIRELCGAFGLTYTRYVDDLMISSQKIICKTLRAKIRDIIKSAGFTINDKKARVHDLSRGPVEVNGIGITYEGRTFLPRRVLRSIRGMIYCALHDKPVNVPRIHGLMGIFKQSTNMRDMNSTERKLFEMYTELQERGITHTGILEADDSFDDYVYPHPHPY